MGGVILEQSCLKLSCARRMHGPGIFDTSRVNSAANLYMAASSLFPDIIACHMLVIRAQCCHEFLCACGLHHHGVHVIILLSGLALHDVACWLSDDLPRLQNSERWYCSTNSLGYTKFAALGSLTLQHLTHLFLALQERTLKHLWC